MPLTRSDISNLLTSGLKTIFFDAYDAAGPAAQYPRIATVVPSGKDQESYGWLGAIPTMREFVDERMPKGLSEHNYSIRNKKWEVSIGVDRDALDDDQYGQIRVRVQGLGAEAQRHKDQLVFELLAAGFAATKGTCYDGQYFFDSDHSEGESGTQSNVGTSALSAVALQAAITAMMKIKDDQGKVLGILPDLLVIPPDLQWTAIELLESVMRPDSALQIKNVLQGRLNFIVSPYLTDTNNWYLLDTKKVVKPTILQDRMPVEFGALEADSENGFMRDQYVYGTRARYNGGYGLWQCAYGSNVT